MSNIKSITFKITDNFSDVNLANLPEFNHSQLNVDTEKEGETPPTISVLRTSVAPSDNPEEKHLFNRNNSFINSCFDAYSRHHGLVIRPDDIWIAIVTQFSFYINAFSEELRNKIVDFEGKRNLDVSVNASLLDAPYDEMTLKMTELIAKNIKDPSLREWALPAFTTTTYTDRVVGAVCLMATMKNYFNYSFSLLCGLPSVTLLGSEEDWKQLIDKVQRLNEFDLAETKYMSKWTAMLNPVLDKFLESVRGKPDTNWWNQIANHIGGGSGPRYLSGWITVFNVFSPKGKWFGDDKRKKPNGKSFDIMGLGLFDHRSDWPLVDTNDIAPGYSQLDITLNDHGTPRKAKMFAGHYTVKVQNKNTLIPQLNWSLTLCNSDIVVPTEKTYQ
ncbi:hypothetical protein PPL_01898 [Heterostelium album PN500]|uniref:DUF4419 domain-containing protein n=1 Tax=Heterostelium pallidum (strain ATCC 26659 / Pp 5 / PN500) TaxID=670386 RepID=D3B0T1_HETP5|nr:hypothetical protein PPL_01898 [Heterostelium album PN500]EFA84905.1 hypothetical protein PPL_01898 [Heterostelium album PN500]|eukprot:XP_020437015.1 hypothetical protein PPL_01898 [Heterostelium album PN500]